MRSSELRPQPEDFDFDLKKALRSVVSVTTQIPEDAMTADILGTERMGNGVVIRDNIVLTIGYLVTEAETVWLTSGEVTTQGHVLGYDQATGFGLIQALGQLNLPTLPLGDSDATKIGDSVVIAGAGGIDHAVAAHIVAKQEFAGYWEYLLDEALFTAPAHPHWGGTALIDSSGALLGIGSLQVEHSDPDGDNFDLNMVVPINLLKPILEDVLKIGRADRPPRPWLGLYTAEIDGQIVVAGIASDGPSDNTELEVGDIVIGVGNKEVHDLAAFFRAVWALGPAGVEVPLDIHREGAAFEVTVQSVDRTNQLKGPVVH
ncbi:MAG: serine protease [Hyphomicrobiaceae bacterium]